MYNIGICDDGINICAAIEKMILNYSQSQRIELDVKVWYTGETLCEYLGQGNHLDILFLDIELFDVTGIEVGNFIRELLGDRGMQIVYISGRTIYAQKLFKTQPMDFLIKPIIQEQINETLALAFKIIKKSTQKFEFQNGKDYFYVSFKEIMYFCSEGRKIRIITSFGQQEFYGKLKEVIRKLPQEFIAIHQSYIINKQYILKYTYEFVELIDGTILTISKTNRKHVREMILKDE